MEMEGISLGSKGLNVLPSHLPTNPVVLTDSTTPAVQGTSQRVEPSSVVNTGQDINFNSISLDITSSVDPLPSVAASISSVETLMQISENSKNHSTSSCLSYDTYCPVYTNTVNCEPLIHSSYSALEQSSYENITTPGTISVEAVSRLPVPSECTQDQMQKYMQDSVYSCGQAGLVATSSVGVDSVRQQLTSGVVSNQDQSVYSNLDPATIHLSSSSADIIPASVLEIPSLGMFQSQTCSSTMTTPSVTVSSTFSPQVTLPDVTSSNTTQQFLPPNNYSMPRVEDENLELPSSDAFMNILDYSEEITVTDNNNGNYSLPEVENLFIAITSENVPSQSTVEIGQDGNVMFCYCMPSVDREEIPEDQIFSKDGQLYRLPHVGFLVIGPYEFCGYHRGGSWYLSLWDILNQIAAPQKEVFIQCMVRKNDLIETRDRLSLCMEELEYLRQKKKVRHQTITTTLLSLRILRKICLEILDVGHSDVISSFFRTIVYSNCFFKQTGSCLKCSKCGNLVNRGPVKETYVIVKDDFIHCPPKPKLDYATNTFKVGTLLVKDVVFPIFQVDSKTYVCIKTLISKRVIGLSVFQHRLATLEGNPRRAPSTIDFYFESQRVGVFKQEWIDLVTLRCICCMGSSRSNYNRSDLYQSFAKGQYKETFTIQLDVIDDHFLDAAVATIVTDAEAAFQQKHTDSRMKIAKMRESMLLSPPSHKTEPSASKFKCGKIFSDSENTSSKSQTLYDSDQEINASTSKKTKVDLDNVKMVGGNQPKLTNPTTDFSNSIVSGSSNKSEKNSYCAKLQPNCHGSTTDSETNNKNVLRFRSDKHLKPGKYVLPNRETLVMFLKQNGFVMTQNNSDLSDDSPCKPRTESVNQLRENETCNVTLKREKRRIDSPIENNVESTDQLDEDEVFETFDEIEDPLNGAEIANDLQERDQTCKTKVPEKNVLKTPSPKKKGKIGIETIHSFSTGSKEELLEDSVTESKTVCAEYSQEMNEIGKSIVTQQKLFNSFIVNDLQERDQTCQRTVPEKNVLKTPSPKKKEKIGIETILSFSTGSEEKFMEDSVNESETVCAEYSQEMDELGKSIVTQQNLSNSFSAVQTESDSHFEENAETAKLTVSKDNISENVLSKKNENEMKHFEENDETAKLTVPKDSISENLMPKKNEIKHSLLTSRKTEENASFNCVYSVAASPLSKIVVCSENLEEVRRMPVAKDDDSELNSNEDNMKCNVVSVSDKMVVFHNNSGDILECTPMFSLNESLQQRPIINNSTHTMMDSLSVNDENQNNIQEKCVSVSGRNSENLVTSELSENDTFVRTPNCGDSEVIDVKEAERKMDIQQTLTSSVALTPSSPLTPVKISTPQSSPILDQGKNTSSVEVPMNEVDEDFDSSLDMLAAVAGAVSNNLSDELSSKKMFGVLETIFKHIRVQFVDKNDKLKMKIMVKPSALQTFPGLYNPANVEKRQQFIACLYRILAWRKQSQLKSTAIKTGKLKKRKIPPRTRTSARLKKAKYS